MTDLLETIPGIGTPEEFKKNMEVRRKVDAEMSEKYGKDWNVFKKKDKKREEKHLAYKELTAKYSS